MTVEHPICYQSYLFRLWRDDPDSPLRAVLRDPQSGEVYGFSSLKALYDFIDRQAAQISAASEPGQN